MSGGLDDILALRVALALGLSLFFGLAFEEFYAEEPLHRPGGIRTFPMLTTIGLVLWAAAPDRWPYVGGMLAIASWLFAYYRRSLEPDSPGRSHGEILMVSCSLAAYAIAPLALTQSAWMSVGLTVAATLFLTGRDPLHAAVKRLNLIEISTAGRFLLLAGVALPLLAGRPAFPHTNVTPFNVGLAVVAVSALSYASYLLQVYVVPGRGVLLAAVLGGMYSSTATTVVLARKARDEGMTPEIEAGIVAATGMMYLRITIVIAIFSLPLARALALPLLPIGAAMLLLAWWLARRGGPAKGTPAPPPGNPLQLSTAAIFAVLLVVISLASTWVQAEAGRAGVLALAAVVGVTDIDPFVLSLAQGGVAHVGLATAATAIAIAASSNNVLKAVYTLAFARVRTGALPAAILVASALAGLVGAWLMAR